MKKKIIITSPDIFNIKSHDLITEYLTKHAGYKLLSLNGKQAVDFIKKNNSRKTRLVIYNQDGNPKREFENTIISYLHSLSEKLLARVLIFTVDFWYYNGERASKHRYGKLLLDKVFKTKTYKVVTLAPSLDSLSSFHKFNYTKFKGNVICNNFWSCYKSSFIRFNSSPCKKILLSGTSSHQQYPERWSIAKFSNVETPQIKNGDSHTKTHNTLYNELLNQYIACFASSVYVYNKSSGNIENTHLILLKTFEILASGALLIQPEIEVPYLKDVLGLIKGKHYLTINFDKENIQEQIDSILENPRIHEIRKAGQDYAKENLTSEKKYLELKEIGLF